ncbi:MAG TPA: hypothetical protein VNH14_00135 [Gemmatimonadales bacterium]|nr:hypothetical protein [Gemmatimonadales bacterium]
MIDRDEHELRERFAALRREESAGAPEFRRMLAAARTRPRSGRRDVGFLAAAALVLIAFVAILTVRHEHRTPVDLAGVRVHAPTDFLLKLPGAELLRTVPRLGRVSLNRRAL